MKLVCGMVSDNIDIIYNHKFIDLNTQTHIVSSDRSKKLEKTALIEITINYFHQIVDQFDGNKEEILNNNVIH